MSFARLTTLALTVCLLLGACSGTADDDAAGAAPSPDTARPEQVTFGGGDLRLVGDLYLPEESGPHAGVVLIHGSGPLDRHETVPGQVGLTFPEPVTVFADLARALRSAGYAVLTYDKRTCGPFNDCADNGYPQPAPDVTIDDFIGDAAAAVSYLRQRTDLRPDAIAVAGHSQGASFVPTLLHNDPGLAAGVMLAAPYDPIDEVAAPPAQIRQWRRTLTADGDRVVRLDCITHALNCLETDDMTAIVPADVGRTVDAGVTTAIVDFLDGAVR